MHHRRRLYPEIEPYRTGPPARLRASTSSTSRSAATRAASRRCSCTAAPAAASSREAAPLLRSGDVPHRAVRPARLRQEHAARLAAWTTPPGTWSPTSSGCASTSDRALAGVRRLLGQHAALAYAETHPERVTELVLRGIFLLRKQEIDWFYQRGASALFPDAWEDYLAPIPEAERGDLLHAYHRRLTSDDAAVRIAAAQGLERLGGQHAAACHRPRADRRAPAATTFAAGLRAHRVPLLRQRRLLRREDQLLRRRAAASGTSPA